MKTYYKIVTRRIAFFFFARTRLVILIFNKNSNALMVINKQFNHLANGHACVICLFKAKLTLKKSLPYTLLRMFDYISNFVF